MSKLTAEQVSSRYNVEISPQQLGAMRRQRREAKGPPFRYTLEYPPAVLTAGEEAEALAQAASDDEAGIVGAEEGTYSVLNAQTLEAAKNEAERLWCNELHEGAIGYAIHSADWSCRDAYYVPLDNVVMLGHVRSR